jgi:hypothetical protein
VHGSQACQVAISQAQQGYQQHWQHVRPGCHNTAIASLIQQQCSYPEWLVFQGLLLHEGSMFCTQPGVNHKEEYTGHAEGKQ